MNPEEENEFRESAQALAMQIRENAKRLGISEEKAIELYIQRSMETGDFEGADFMATVREAVTDPLEKIDDVVRRLRETETDDPDEEKPNRPRDRQ